MKSLIWFIDGKFSVTDVSMTKVIRTAKSMQGSVQIVFDKRVRSKEKWYWPLSQKQISELSEFNAKQDAVLDKIAENFEDHGVIHDFHLVHTADYLSTLANIFSAYQVSCLVVDTHERAARHPIFQRLAYLSVPVLLITQRRWPAEVKFIAAVDPLHENARPGYMDNDIVKITRTWVDNFKSQWILVHCCFVAPLFLEHKKTISKMHAEGFAAFAQKQHVKERQMQLLDGIPEHSLPRYVKNQMIDVLVLGLVARNQLEAMWVGSTTMALLDEPPCDMLMVTQSTNGKVIC